MKHVVNPGHVLLLFRQVGQFSPPFIVYNSF